MLGVVNSSCFMEPLLKMSAISTPKDLTEASVGSMVSGYTIALEGKEGLETKLTVMIEQDLKFI